MNTVNFGDKNSYVDFELILSKKKIGFPRARKIQITVPGRNGYLDATESLTGSVIYDNRELSFVFTLLNENRLSEIATYLHGNKIPITLSTDSDYYYEGRCEITDCESEEGITKITVTCDCDPFKINIKTKVKCL